MKKSLILLLALFVQLSAFAGLRSGHFFKSLQRENLTEQQAVECFSQWFALPMRPNGAGWGSVLTAWA